ncbi:MAG: VanW family protein [Oscillospiraceae bacterium]
MLKLLYPCAYADGVFDIDYVKLYDKGYRGIIFDIDNTLVHHGDDSTKEVDELFKYIQGIGFKTVLLTDNEKSRVERFIKNIDTPYICDADKPDTAGYMKAVKVLRMEKEKVVLIGDQIFTDILGANKSGIDSILVKFIRLKEETKIGKRRHLENIILGIYRRDKNACVKLGDVCLKGDVHMEQKKRKLFCEINPLCYAISEQKEILKRNISDIRTKEKFAQTKSRHKLPNVVDAQSSNLIKRGKGIDIRLQKNKAVNIDLASRKICGIIIEPGEVFSFWRTIGSITKRKGYKEGRVIIGNELKPRLGGGLCNLGNTIHRLILHSPLEVVEFHSHSDALAPEHGERVPFSSGTSVSYNYIDYRFKNNTDQKVQLLVWTDDEKLYGQLRSERPFPERFELSEENHHFVKENGKYYRISKIYKNVIDRKTGKLLDKQLVLDNHSEVMYDYDLIPKELIKC